MKKYDKAQRMSFLRTTINNFFHHKQTSMKHIWLFALPLFLFSCNIQQPKDKQTDNNGNDSQTEMEQHVLTAEEVYNNSVNKVALLLCYENGVPSSQGSGFFIDKNTLVTNYHVIEGTTSIEIKTSEEEDFYRGGKVVLASEEFDLAIIRTNKDFPFFSIDSTGKEKVGSKVYTIGNPRGLEGTISDGILSGKRNEYGTEYLQITAPISPGNSGGPLLNENGEVIGVSTFTFVNGQNLNFAMPIKYISKCTTYTYQPKTNNSSRESRVGNHSDAVTMFNYSKDQGYQELGSFSLKNNSDNYVRNIIGVMIYREKGEIIHYKIENFNDEIAPGMAKRFQRTCFPNSTDYYSNGYAYSAGKAKKFTAEFILLSYEIFE